MTGNVDVNVYVDLNGQWVSGDRGSQLVWNFDHVSTQSGATKLKKWQFSRQNELLVSEFADRAEWGTLHFVAPKVIPLRPMVCNLVVVTDQYLSYSRKFVMSLGRQQ